MNSFKELAISAMAGIMFSAVMIAVYVWLKGAA